MKFSGHIHRAILSLCMMGILIDAGKVLLFPYGHGFTSRLADMRNMGHILHNQGHQVTFLINEEDRRHLENVPEANFYVYPTPEGRVALIDDEALKSSFIKSENTTQETAGQVIHILKRQLSLCEELLKRKQMLQEIKAVKYDLLIVDFAENCGRILTQYLDIPTMAYSSTGLSVDSVLFPNIPSVVPAPFMSSTSNMSFLGRVKNAFVFIFLDRAIGPYFYSSFDNLQKKYGLNQQPRLPFEKVYTDQIFLSHTDFALEEPRPLLPNVILVGGMHVPEVKPLDPSIKAFMDGAGDAGVILVSFGSLISRMDTEKSELIARVLAKLEQKVIWRLKGTPPKGLGSNTLLLEWLPQNDILAHPNTKAFVTHCGIHSTYETLSHGVPVVAIPLMFDQNDNAVKLTKRAKMGLSVDFKTMTEGTLGEAISKVILDPQYKENAVYSAQVLRDHPLTAQERFLFYVDYMIRHKGIGRLKLEPITYLNSLQLYCIDVCAFILCVVSILILVCFQMLRFCWRRLCSRGRDQLAPNKKTS